MEPPMVRKKASEYDPGLFELYDRYVHGGISRREFIDGAKRFAAGGLTGAALLREISPDYALAQQIAPDDERITNEFITYPSPRGHGEIRAYLVRPAGVAGPLPAVVVVHENRGLNPYIQDVARRLGAANFLALAPDGLSPVGGYPGDDDRGRELQSSLEPARLMEDFIAAVEFLLAQPIATAKVGIVGFCYGGLVSNTAAVRVPDLAAAVPFYGRQPAAEDVPRIRASLLLHFAENDPGVNAGWPAYEAALQANAVSYEAHFYPGTNHGFHNDTTPRYDHTAAQLAWARTLAHFDRTLRE
jgi:carboxymethylenebutenolidase